MRQRTMLPLSKIWLTMSSKGEQVYIFPTLTCQDLSTRVRLLPVSIHISLTKTIMSQSGLSFQGICFSF